MFHRLLAYAVAAVAVLASVAGAARAATSYDVSTNASFTVLNDGKEHTVLASPTKLTGSWLAIGTIDVVQTIGGGVDFFCFVGNSRVDLSLDQTGHGSGIISVSSLLNLKQPTTIGLNCTVGANVPAYVVALSAHLSLVPVANVTSSVQTTPQN